MAQISEKTKIYFDEAVAFLSTLTPMHWGIIGGSLLVLFLIKQIIRRSRRRAMERLAPQLSLHAFQVAPLGRDAFLKIKNTGAPATISRFEIKGRKDILVKNEFAGHQIAKDKVYSLLLEASESDRIRADFTIELTFLDDKRNVFKQNFKMEGNTAGKLILIKKA